MHVTLYTNKSTTNYGKRLAKLGFTFDVLPLRTDLENAARDLYAQRGESTDVVQFIFDDWTESPSLRGRHFGRPFSTYRACIVRHRRGWEDTAEHELLHAANSIVWTYTSVSLSTVFDVVSFDEDVVHGAHPHYTEYAYDSVWPIVLPHLSRAVLNRRNLASAYDRLVVLLKEMVARLQNRIEEIHGITHPFAGFTVTQAYGLPNARYPRTKRHIGTDYACPIGTPIPAPKDGNVIVSGYSASLGYYCHFVYAVRGEQFTDRYLHLKAAPLRGLRKQGETIGFTGATGDADGAHCHVDVWRNDVRVDLIDSKNWGDLTVDPETHYA